MEKTLIVFKPDAIERGIVGEVLTRFERVGLKIVGMKMVQPSKEHLFYHYETIGTMVTRHGETIFNNTVEYVMKSPVIAAVLEGVEAVATVRKMVGATEPKSALPGTVRGDYAHMSYGHADGLDMALVNILHASGDSAEAKLEVAHWFSESELFDYEPVHQKHTQPKKK